MNKSKEPVSFKTWVANVWYYYKWIIIFGGLILAFVVFALVQMLCKVEPDVNIMYIGSGALTVKDNANLKSFVSTQITDSNGDGKIEIGYLELTAKTGIVDTASGEQILDYDINNATVERFDFEVSMGDSIIYLVDEYYYKRLKSKNILTRLSDLLSESQMPQRTYDEFSVRLKDTALSRADGFKYLPSTTLVCIRNSPENDELPYGRTVAEWEANRDCFVKLLTWHSGEVVFNDKNVSAVYYGNGKIGSDGQYYLKRWLQNALSETMQNTYGDVVIGYSAVTPPVIIEGNESQEALSEEELYREIVTLLKDGQSHIIFADEKELSIIAKYGAFVALGDAFSDGVTPPLTSSSAIPKELLPYALCLTDLESKELSGLNELPENTWILITSGENQENNIEALDKLLRYTRKIA